MAGTATKVEPAPQGFRGDAAHYTLTPDLYGMKDVIVSAVADSAGPETALFPATPDGKIDVEIYYSGGFNPPTIEELSHEALLERLGYTISPN